MNKQSYKTDLQGCKLDTTQTLTNVYKLNSPESLWSEWDWVFILLCMCTYVSMLTLCSFAAVLSSVSHVFQFPPWEWPCRLGWWGIRLITGLSQLPAKRHHDKQNCQVGIYVSQGTVPPSLCSKHNRGLKHCAWANKTYTNFRKTHGKQKSVHFLARFHSVTSHSKPHSFSGTQLSVYLPTECSYSRKRWR